MIDKLLYKTIPEWAERRYLAACGTWRWRFWFEVTGQGRTARSYMRIQRTYNGKHYRNLQDMAAAMRADGVFDNLPVMKRRVNE